MGLSASQGRLLTLTSRLSNLEYRSQNIANQKVRLADESEAISKNYLNALNAKKLTVYNPETNAYTDASLSTIYKMNGVASNGTKRIVVDSLGNIVCPDEYKNNETYVPQNSYYKQTGKSYASGSVVVTQELLDSAYSKAQTAKENLQSVYGKGEAGKQAFMLDMLNNHLNNGDTTLFTSVPQKGDQAYPYYQEKIAYYENCWSGLEAYAQMFGYTTADASQIQENDLGYYYDPLSYINGSVFSTNNSVLSSLTIDYQMQEDGKDSVLTMDTFNAANIAVKFSNDTEYLYTQLSMGNWFIVEWNDEGGPESTGAWETISYTSGDSQLVVNTDDTTLAKAEAEYERAMAEVSAKDKRYDLELKVIDSEHSAVQTEMESVKQVMNKNIERTFKLFS